MGNSHSFIWSEGGLIIEDSKTQGSVYIPWEQVESFGARTIREAGAYDQALTSRRALGVRYGKNS